ncbi:hypothetical protein HK102_004763, partial [Quaeritorhiza haematococci]
TLFKSPNPTDATASHTSQTSDVDLDTPALYDILNASDTDFNDDVTTFQPLFIPCTTTTTQCPAGYTPKPTGCVFDGAEFSLHTEVGMIIDFVPANADTDGSAQSFPVHHVVFVVTGTASQGASVNPPKRVPVPNIPIEILFEEKDQPVIAFDPDSGLLKQSTVKAGERFQVVTNELGRAEVSFPIRWEKYGLVQRMKVSAGFMESDAWKPLQADRALVDALRTLTAEQIQRANPEIAGDVAEKASASVRLLIRKATEKDKNWKDDVESQNRLMGRAKSDDRDHDVDQQAVLDDADSEIQDIEISPAPHPDPSTPNTALEAKLTIGKKVVKVLVKSLKMALKVIMRVLKWIKVGIDALLKAVKTVTRWDDVANTQLHLEYYITGPQGLRDRVTKSVSAALDKSLRCDYISFKKHPRPSRSNADSVSEAAVAAYTITNSLSRARHPITSTTNQQHLANLQSEIATIQQATHEIIETNTGINGKLKKALQRLWTACRKTLETLAPVREIAKDLIKGLGIMLGAVAIIVLFHLNAIFVAAPLWYINLLVKVFFLVLELPMDFTKIDIEKKNDGKVYFTMRPLLRRPKPMTLLSWLLLPVSIAYTHGYMLAHPGKSPFPKFSPMPAPALPQNVPAAQQPPIVPWPVPSRPPSLPAPEHPQVAPAPERPHNLPAPAHPPRPQNVPAREPPQVSPQVLPAPGSAPDTPKTPPRLSEDPNFKPNILRSRRLLSRRGNDENADAEVAPENDTNLSDSSQLPSIQSAFLTGLRDIIPFAQDPNSPFYVLGLLGSMAHMDVDQMSCTRGGSE